MLCNQGQSRSGFSPAFKVRLFSAIKVSPGLVFSCIQGEVVLCNQGQFRSGFSPAFKVRLFSAIKVIPGLVFLLHSR